MPKQLLRDKITVETRTLQDGNTCVEADTFDVISEHAFFDALNASEGQVTIRMPNGNVYKIVANVV